MTEENKTNVETEKPIFICHNSENSSCALALAHALESRGFRTWIYELDSVAGASKLDQECEVIGQTSRAMVALFSPETIPHVENVLMELTAARIRQKTDPSYKLLLYTVRVEWKLFLRQLAANQQELLESIAGRIVDPLKIEPILIMAKDFDLETRIKTDAFLSKLFHTDLQGINPQQRDDNRLARIKLKWGDLEQQNSNAAQSPIMICYNTEVSAHAVALALVLESVGFRTWIYELDGRAGDGDRVDIEGRVIRHSQAMIVLLSKALMRHSGNILTEIARAKDRHNEYPSFRSLFFTVDIDPRLVRKTFMEGHSSVLQGLANTIITSLALRPVTVLNQVADLESIVRDHVSLQQLLDVDLHGILRSTPDDKRIQALRDMLRERVGKKACVISSGVSIVAMIAVAAFIMLPKIANIESPIMVAGLNTESNPVPTIYIPATDAVVVPVAKPIKRGTSSGLNVKTGAKLSFATDIPLPARYILKLRYSNDHYADEPDKVRIIVNGRDTGILVLQNTRPEEGLNPDGWANIVETNLDFGSLEAGSANIDLIMEQTDTYGAEIHGIVLTPTP